MASQKRLGVYWNDVGIDFVEVHKNVPVLKMSIPFSFVSDNEKSDILSVSEDARFIETIQRTCRNAGFSVVDACLSLSSKDIIVRWFMIPFMKPQEIQGVVPFEARKYLPFPIEDLVFNYYPSIKSGGISKQIGILFVGIKRDIYQRCIGILSQAGFNVVYSEPACMSFLRALTFRRLIDSDQVAAVLMLDKNYGEINIVSNGVVKFVRDFSLANLAGLPDPGGDFLRTKLFNEVRISLDFFNRQSLDIDVNRIIALAPFLDSHLYVGFSEEMNVPVLPLEAGSVLDMGGAAELGSLGAFGVALCGSVPGVIDLNLAETELKTVSGSSVAIPSRVSFLLPVVVGGILLVILVGFWIFFSNAIRTQQEEVAGTAGRLGKYADVPLEEIESNDQRAAKLLKAFKVFPLRSSIAPLLLEVIQVLPSAMWVNNLTFEYVQVSVPVKDDSALDMPKLVLSPVMTLSVKGVVAETNAGFIQVNDLVVALRNNPNLRLVFKEVIQGDVSTAQENGRMVISFSLTLK